MLLRIAAVTQIALAGLSLCLPRILDWKADIARMSLLVRQVFEIHAWFIALTLVIWGVLTWRFAPEMVLSPTALSRMAVRSHRSLLGHPLRVAVDPLRQQPLARKSGPHRDPLAALPRLRRVGRRLLHHCLQAMKTEAPAFKPTWLPNAAGRERMLATPGDPLFRADWDRVLMMHFEMAPEALQPHVPFDLDLREGRAFVSLVAFTMRGMRFWRGGSWTAALLRPMATHEFLNVRTYVKHHGEPGIFFIAEWLPNQLSVLLGRPLFGLPYRLGALHYEHAHENDQISGQVTAAQGNGILRYRANLAGDYDRCEAGSTAEFLMERYSAFTDWHGLKRRFRIWHTPWLQCPAETEIEENTLMNLAGPWAREARFIGANYSPSATEVWMGRPVFAGSSKSQTSNSRS